LKILFISWALPPLLYPQSIQIGRFLYYLKKYKDLEIVVVTADEKGSRVDNQLYPDIFENLEVLKIENSFNIYTNYIKNRFFPFIFQRPDIYKNWMEKAYKEIIKRYKNFDVILTFSYPLSTNLLGKKLKEFYKTKWVSHNSDPWADNVHLHIPSYLKNYHQKLEKESFFDTDCLIFTSKETAEFYKEKYPTLNINYINHSFDKTLYPNIKNDDGIIRYIGSFYGARTPAPLFEALKKLKEYPKIELVGGGKKAELLLQQYKLKNVKVTPPVSYIKSLELMKKSKLLLVIDAPAKKSIFFPSKLADYIGANRPIFGISPAGTTNRILNELGYKCVDTNEIEEITKFTESFDIISDKVVEYDIENNIKMLKRFIDE